MVVDSGKIEKFENRRRILSCWITVHAAPPHYRWFRSDSDVRQNRHDQCVGVSTFTLDQSKNHKKHAIRIFVYTTMYLWIYAPVYNSRLT